MTALAVTGAVVGVGTSIASAVKANNDQKEAELKMKEQEDILKGLEDSRQAIYNPFQNLTNEASKVGVATQAAEFQAEEADQALANTLDTILATGGGSSGATALAQMALKSKQGISADIQKQELQNAKNIANTQMALNEAKAQGAKWAWEEQEMRDVAQLNRAQNLADKFEAQSYAAEQEKWAAFGNVASSLTGGVGNIGEGIEMDQALAAANG